VRLRQGHFHIREQHKLQLITVIIVVVSVVEPRLQFVRCHQLARKKLPGRSWQSWKTPSHSIWKTHHIPQETCPRTSYYCYSYFNHHHRHHHSRLTFSRSQSRPNTNSDLQDSGTNCPVPWVTLSWTKTQDTACNGTFRMTEIANVMIKYLSQKVTESKLNVHIFCKRSLRFM